MTTSTRSSLSWWHRSPDRCASPSSLLWHRSPDRCGPALLLLLALLLFPLTPLAAASPPAAPPPPPAVIRSASDLLLALENADRGLRALSAGIQYAKEFSQLEGADRQAWRGRLYVSSDAPRGAADPPPANTPPATGPLPAEPARRFAVYFDTLFVDAQRRDESKIYIFDGEWFVEKLPEQRQQFARQVVPPGQRIDPLKIGEGPFPIPIGQRRDAILARFEATLVEPLDGLASDALRPEMLAMMRDTYQIRLTPRPGTDEARNYVEVRIWYRRDDLLPRMARTVSSDGSRTEVLLINIKRNPTRPDGTPEVTRDLFDTTPAEGWVEQRTEFRSSSQDGARIPVQPPPIQPPENQPPSTPPPEKDAGTGGEDHPKPPPA